MGSGSSKVSEEPSQSRSPINNEVHARDLPPRSPDLSELHRLSNTYKEGSFLRVATKCTLAGIAGLIIGPIANRGRVLNTALVGSANAVFVIGFYDIIREALTATTVADTPFISGAAGALTGYVWNGLVHQSKSKAAAGAVAVSGLATIIHVAMPSFAAHKAVLGTLLDFELLSDPDGSLRATADEPPILKPFSTQAMREFLGSMMVKYLPVKEVSDEEYETMKLKDPLRINFRGPLEPEERPEERTDSTKPKPA